ncbi:copper resistance protein B [Pseudoxanthomonas sp. GM95]|uniref:copper resistance protein B n=1 Tax=Pseudoxanthomonas sp. GM95 TaxID=1881043 RepID=UPI0008D1D121|nr:copper resistance protein B [Pseudoxanthomonas sp. GM95]SEL10620.1 copper resistance protein B [Pseudoxanthomonas sp. GM95]
MSPLPHYRSLALACALALAQGSAFAQQHDHAAMQMQDMPGMDMSSMQDTGKPADKKKTSDKAETKPQASTSAPKADPHAGHHDMAMPMDHAQHAPATPKQPATKPKAKTPAAKPKQVTPSRPADPHAGHAMPAGMSMESMPGMDMPMAAPGAPPMDHNAHHGHSAPMPAPLPAPTMEKRAAAFPDLGGMDMSLHMDDNPTVAVLRGDRLEHVEGGGTAWDARFGVGGNFDKFWLRSEGEQHRGEQARGDVQLQWSHATGPWWDRVFSLRSDFGPGPSRQWAGLGVMGLAPYKFELEAHAYIGEQGRLAARVEAEYELLLTNRLILTPRVEFNAYSKDDRANRIGKGLSDGEAGLRLRYEITRQFAPYVGYGWSRSFGDTADLVRADGEPALDHGWVAGLRFWF